MVLSIFLFWEAAFRQWSTLGILCNHWISQINRLGISRNMFEMLSIKMCSFILWLLQMLVCCGIIEILSLDSHFRKVVGWNFRENEKYKSNRQWLTKRVESYKRRWDIKCSIRCRGRVKGFPVTQKRRGNYLWFWPQKVKISQCLIWDYGKLCDKESS